MPTKEQLKDLQSKSLEEKIQISAARIIEWYEKWNGQVYVSFSGGKDSTVLLDLVRRFYPDVEAVFVDTGLEYPEIRDFVKTFENVRWIRPEMNFRKVIEKYGYPVISKNVSHYVAGAKKGASSCLALLSGKYKKPDGTKSNYCCEQWKFLIDSPFKISDYCCQAIKKNTAYQYYKQSKKYPIIATMANESRQRKSQWLSKGCNAFEKAHPSSNPLSFWTEQDVLSYLLKYNLPYASVYGEIIEEKGKLKMSKMQRTGCMFCMYGCHLEKSPNRFQQMAVTHPKQYAYCMKDWEDGGLGLAKVLDYIGVNYKPINKNQDKE